MRDTPPMAEITPFELKALDRHFTQQRQHCAEALARERALNGPRNRRIGELSDQLRRYDVLHARARAASHHAPSVIDPERDDAAGLHELKMLSQTLA